MTTYTDAPGSHSPAVPVVDRADGDAQFGRQFLRTQVLNICHDLRVCNTLCYCHPVEQKTEQSKAHLVSIGYPPDRQPAAKVTVAHDDLPGWAITMLIARDGMVESVEIQPLRNVEHGPEEALRLGVAAVEVGPVTARLLHRIALGECTAAATRAVSEMGLMFTQLRSLTGEPDWVRFAAISEGLASRPGRRGRDERDYAEIAALYVDLLAAGDQTPVDTLAAKTYLSPSQLRNLLYEARRRGLLTKAAPGRAGGTLTDKARQLLEAPDGQH